MFLKSGSEANPFPQVLEYCFLQTLPEKEALNLLKRFDVLTVFCFHGAEHSSKREPFTV